MKQLIIRLCTMIFGLFLYALGIVVTIRANIGYAPWDVLHVGISKTTNGILSIGTVSILTGLFIIVIIGIFGERPGLGTLLNMLLIGIFIDIVLKVDIIPKGTEIIVKEIFNKKIDGYIAGSIMLIVGLFIIAFGSYFYIKTAFGAGPRDSLMVVVAKKTKIPVGICRSAIELLAILGGWLLGGMVGIGTVLSAIGIGFCVQITFKIMKFDVTAVKHESLLQTFQKMRNHGKIFYSKKGAGQDKN